MKYSTRIFSSAVPGATQQSNLGLLSILHHRLQFFFINPYMPSRREAGSATALLHTCKIGDVLFTGFICLTASSLSRLFPSLFHIVSAWPFKGGSCRDRLTHSSYSAAFKKFGKGYRPVSASWQRDGLEGRSGARVKTQDSQTRCKV